MSKNSLETLEAELQAAIAQLEADQLAAKEAQSRIATVESQKRRIESQLAQIREQERLRQVEEDLGSEVHELRALGDSINERSRELFLLLNQFDALRVAIGSKQTETGKESAVIQSHCDFSALPACLHRPGQARIFLTTRGKADHLRDNPARNIRYEFQVDEILGLE